MDNCDWCGQTVWGRPWNVNGGGCFCSERCCDAYIDHHDLDGKKAKAARERAEEERRQRGIAADEEWYARDMAEKERIEAEGHRVGQEAMRNRANSLEDWRPFIEERVGHPVRIEDIRENPKQEGAFIHKDELLAEVAKARTALEKKLDFKFSKIWRLYDFSLDEHLNPPGEDPSDFVSWSWDSDKERFDFDIPLFHSLQVLYSNSSDNDYLFSTRKYCPRPGHYVDEELTNFIGKNPLASINWKALNRDRILANESNTGIFYVEDRSSLVMKFLRARADEIKNEGKITGVAWDVLQKCSTGLGRGSFIQLGNSSDERNIIWNINSDPSWPPETVTNESVDDMKRGYEEEEKRFRFGEKFINRHVHFKIIYIPLSYLAPSYKIKREHILRDYAKYTFSADPVICGACGTKNAFDDKFCAECGADLAKAGSEKQAAARKKAPVAVTCGACGAKSSSADKFCAECGVNLAEAASAKPAAETKKAPVTVFCGECGAKNSSDDTFCGECGAKL